jgi:large subunit ribosomal protein L29
MAASELRGLDKKELAGKPAELKKKVFELKMALKSGRLDSTAELPKAKKELARVMTVLREQEIGIERKPKAAKQAKKK